MYKYYLLEGLLILSVFEGVNEWVDSGGHPGEHRGDDMEGGDTEVIIDDIDQHQGEEADQEGDEDSQHHLDREAVLNKYLYVILYAKHSFNI